MHVVYAATMKVLSVGYVLGVIASKSSNSFKGGMFDYQQMDGVVDHLCVGKRVSR